MTITVAILYDPKGRRLGYLRDSKLPPPRGERVLHSSILTPEIDKARNFPDAAAARAECFGIRDVTVRTAVRMDRIERERARKDWSAPIST